MSNGAVMGISGTNGNRKWQESLIIKFAVVIGTCLITTGVYMSLINNTSADVKKLENRVELIQSQKVESDKILNEFYGTMRSSIENINQNIKDIKEDVKEIGRNQKKG